MLTLRISTAPSPTQSRLAEYMRERMSEFQENMDKMMREQSIETCSREMLDVYARLCGVKDQAITCTVVV